MNVVPLRVRAAAELELRRRSAGSDNPAYQVWQPLPGPQTEGYTSEADVIGFGGQAGGGKSDLQLGKAFTQFKKAIIFRSHFTDLSDIVSRGDDIQDGRCSFVWGIKRSWEQSDGGTVELGAVENDKDKQKYRGRPHDFIGIDEAAEFKEAIYRFIVGWLRTSEEGQRTQVMLTFNPPTSSDGEWIIKYFGPWIDPAYTGIRAKSGELRWFIYANNKDVEVPGPEPVENEGKAYTPKSRTFIRARLEDNPFLARNGAYRGQLESLPEPLRSQLLEGDFGAAQKDGAWQVIPTEWIVAAQNRAIKQGKPNQALRSVGVDPSRGGDDETAIAKLYGNYFELITHAGSDVQDGAIGAALVSQAMGKENASVFVDSIGIGSSVYDHLKVLPNMRVEPVSAGSASDALDRSGRYKFFNLRSQIWWQFREALDPASGQDVCLPPDVQLRNDLRAPHYEVVGAKYKVELKEKTKERIGRSPDRADAVLLAWYGAAHNAGNPILFADPEPDPTADDDNIQLWDLKLS